MQKREQAKSSAYPDGVFLLLIRHREYEPHSADSWEALKRPTTLLVKKRTQNKLCSLSRHGPPTNSSAPRGFAL